MSMHIASLVKIPCYLLKLSSRNENMGVSRADNSIKILRNLPISNPKPELHNINAHTKFGENPLMFTQVIIRKRKTDRRTDGHTDVQRETIISRHYCVAGYKKQEGHDGRYIAHLNHVIHSIANRDAVLKVMVTFTMTFALRVIFWQRCKIPSELTRPYGLNFSLRC